MGWTTLPTELPAACLSIGAPIVTPDGSLYVASRHLYKWNAGTEQWDQIGTYERATDVYVNCAVAIDDNTLFWIRSATSSIPYSFYGVVYDLTDDSFDEYAVPGTSNQLAGLAYEPGATLHSDGDKVVVGAGSNSADGYWWYFDLSGTPQWYGPWTFPGLANWMIWNMHGFMATLGEDGFEKVVAWTEGNKWALKEDLSGWDQIAAHDYYDMPAGYGGNHYFQRRDRALYQPSTYEGKIVFLDGDQVRPYDSTGDRWTGTVSRGEVAYRLRWHNLTSKLWVDCWDPSPVTSAVTTSVYGSTVEVMWAFSDPEGWANAIYEVHLLQEEVVVYDSGEVGSNHLYHAFLGVVNGMYVPQVRVKNADDVWTEWAIGSAFIVSAGGPYGGDETAPTVSILVPVDGATVAGDVTVTAYLTDETALGSAHLWIDGVSIASQLVSGLVATVTFIWDSASWANGSHVIRVLALDYAGNAGYHEHTVTTNNAFSDQRRVRITTLEHLPGIANQVDRARRLFEALKWNPPTGDPWRDYSCIVLCRATDDPNDETTDLLKFRRIPAPGVATHPPPMAGEYFQWAIVADPFLWTGSYLLSPHMGIAALTLGASESDLLILTTGPLAVWRFDGSTVTKLKDIEAIPDHGYVGGIPDPHTLAWVDGLAVFDQAEYLRVVDLDTEERNLDIVVRQDESQLWLVQGVVRESEFEALLAVTNEDGDGSIWRFSWGALQLLGTLTDQAATRVLVTATKEYVGAGGKLYDLEDLVTPLYDTAESAILLLDIADLELLVGTGTGGRLFTSEPSWSLKLDLTGLVVTGTAYVWGALYATCELPQVWRRDPTTSAWALIFEPELDHISALCRYVFPDGEEALAIAGDYGGVAKLILYRVAPDDPSRITSGPLPPKFGMGVAESVRES